MKYRKSRHNNSNKKKLTCEIIYSYAYVEKEHFTGASTTNE